MEPTGFDDLARRLCRFRGSRRLLTGLAAAALVRRGGTAEAARRQVCTSQEAFDLKPCESDAHCTCGFCQQEGSADGFCTCLLNFSAAPACTRDAECCSGKCRQHGAHVGTCRCVPKGGACADNNLKRSKNCCSGTCAFAPETGAGVCV